MTSERETLRARAYLLGRASDEERDVLEREYFRSPEALDLVEAVEETLIEDYLAARLAPEDRALFEQHYLASPLHRTRLETIQRLMTVPHVPAVIPVARARRFSMLAAAAGVVVAVGTTAWFLARSKQVDQPASSAIGPPTSGTAPAQTSPAPVVAFPWTVSPLAVRGSADTPPLVIPTGTAVVRLQLEAEPNAPPLAHGRIVIRRIAGEEVWQAPLSASSPLPGTVAAVTDVPADRLHADDYTITLVETGGAHGDVERARYFLRVRAR